MRHNPNHYVTSTVSNDPTDGRGTGRTTRMLNDAIQRVFIDRVPFVVVVIASGTYQYTRDLLLDLLSKRGIPFFYEKTRRWVCTGDRKGHIKFKYDDSTDMYGDFSNGYFFRGIDPKIPVLLDHYSSDRLHERERKRDERDSKAVRSTSTTNLK